MPVAHELGQKAWAVFRRKRGRSGDAPACLRRTRLDPRVEPEENRGHALVRAGKRQPAALREIEELRIGRQFEDHRAQARAGERIGRGAQRILRIGCAHQEQFFRIEAELENPASGNLAMLGLRKILADPEKRFLLRHARREKCGKADRGGGVSRRSEDFMLRAAQQPAAKARVGAGMAEGRTAIRVLLLERQDRAPQRRDGMGALTVHVMF